MASTRTRWRWNSPKSPCGSTRSPSARRCLSSIIICVRATASSAPGCARRSMRCKERGALFNLGQIARVERVAGVMAEIEETTDNDVAEVASSKAKFGTVEEVTEPIAALFSLLTAEQMLGVFDAAPAKAPRLEKLRRKVGETNREGARRSRRVRARGGAATRSRRHVRRSHQDRERRRARRAAGTGETTRAAARGAARSAEPVPRDQRRRSPARDGGRTWSRRRGRSPRATASCIGRSRFRMSGRISTSRRTARRFRRGHRQPALRSTGTPRR